MKIFWAIIAIVLVVGGWYFVTNRAPVSTTNNMNPIVLMRTNKGEIKLEIFQDKAPLTAKNFLTLAEKNFYDDTLFHRVIDGFMIQGGDPNTRAKEPNTWGTGGPGYTIPDEFSPGLSNIIGTISMANSGPNTGGSQFFINVADNTYLDGKHAVFGKVLDGMDVVLAISKSSRDSSDRPIDPVRIDAIIVKK